MPILDTFLPETTIQVIEPVSEQIARSVLNVMGMGPMFKDNLFLESDIQKSSKFNSDNSTKRTTSNRCDIEIVPNYNPAESAWDTFTTKDTYSNASMDRNTFGNYPLFADKRAGITLFEVTVPCSVELNFSLKIKSIELADLVNNVIYSQAMTTGSVFNYNDILFSYPMADKTLIMLKKMYDMQDDMSSSITFPQYLTYHSGDKISILLNRHKLENGDKELVIQRSNIMVLGLLEYSGDKPEVEDINKVADRFVISFKYTYQFSRPVMLRLYHPLMINNKLLTSKLVRPPVKVDHPDIEKTYPDVNINKHWLDRDRAINLRRSYPLVRYPWYDEWDISTLTVSDYHLKYQQLFIGILSVDVDPATGNQSLSIDIDGDVFPMLDISLVAEIRRVWGLSSKDEIVRRGGIFHLGVFSNDNVVDFTNLDLTIDRFLTINAPVDIMKTYRLVISQILDIRLLKAKFIYYMLDNPDYYLDYLTVNIKYLRDNRFIEILTNELTTEQYVQIPARFEQPPSIGNRYGFGRAITLGKHIVTVSRHRRRL